MNAASLALTLPGGITALGKSLNDPKVVGIAQSLNLNLRDPATLSRLLSETTELLLSSTQVSLSKEEVPPQYPVPGQSQYVRNALRTYREIAAMA